MRYLIVFLIASSTTISSLCSQDVLFYAQTDAKQIVAGNYFEVTFTLENAKGQSFVPPDFSDFEILSGPSRSSQMSIVNGRMSQKMSFSYGLTVMKPGKVRLGAATITVNGKKYSSDPITIDVLQAKKTVANSSSNNNSINTGDFFVEAQLSYDTAYIGQQVTLKYVLYTTKDIRSYSFAKAPSFDGFFAQEIQNYRDRPQQVVRDGVQYVTRTVKVIALFPQQKGVFTIEPAQINLGISTKNSRTSFFFNSNLKTVRVASGTADILITDLPTGAPSSFSGAIGDFYLGSAIDKRKLSMDDALTLTYQIKGDGDGKLILPPDQPLGDLFDIYEPNLLREESVVQGAKIVTTKTYEYLMIPKKEGRVSFNPELSFYDLEQNKYTTIKGETYTVVITPSTGRQTVDLATQKEELPAIFSTTKLKDRNSFFLYSTPYWLANGTLALGLIGMLVVKKIQVDRSKIDPTVLKHSKAKKMAIAQLSQAKKAWDQGDTKEFYIQLRKGLVEYLSSKTYQSSAQMSKADISDLLHKNGLEAIESEILNIMQKGEMAIYANMTPGNENDLYQTAINLIEKVETTLKK